MTNHVEVTRLLSQHGYLALALGKIGDSALGNCYIQLSTSTLTITTHCGKEVATWPYSFIRDFNCHDDIFTFTSGRKGPFGVEKYDFQFVPSTFEMFKAALSTATGAKFGHSTPEVKTTPSSSTPDTVLNERYVFQPSRLITHASNVCSDIPNGVTVPNDFMLCRLSSTSSSSSSSSSSSFAEEYATPTLRKQLSVPSLKRVVHQYEDVDMTAEGNDLSNSPSTSPFTYAASNSTAGDDLRAGNGPRRTASNPSSFEDTALPSAPGRTKTIPLSTANNFAPAVQTRAAGEHKLSTVYENLNPYQRYDFVPLRQQSSCAPPLHGSHDLQAPTQLSFISGDGNEVLYDVPRSLHGGTLPPQALTGPSTHRSIHENFHCSPYENVLPDSIPVSCEGNSSNQSRRFRVLSPPPSTTTTTIPLHHQYVNVMGLTQQLVQDMPISGDGIQSVGRAQLPLSAAARPTSLGTADKDAKHTSLEGDYIPMSPSEPGMWTRAQGCSAASQPYSMHQQHALNGRLEHEEEEGQSGYVTMRRQATWVRDPTFVQRGGEGDKAQSVRAGL